MLFTALWYYQNKEAYFALILVARLSSSKGKNQWFCVFPRRCCPRTLFPKDCSLIHPFFISFDCFGFISFLPLLNINKNTCHKEIHSRGPERTDFMAVYLVGSDLALLCPNIPQFEACPPRQLTVHSWAAYKNGTGAIPSLQCDKPGKSMMLSFLPSL